MTTDIEARRAYWKTVYSGLRAWKILSGPLITREKALEVEAKIAREHGCDVAPGGDETDDPTGPWYVYHFDYDDEDALNDRHHQARSQSPGHSSP